MRISLISVNRKSKRFWQDIMDTEMLRRRLEIFAADTVKYSKVSRLKRLATIGILLF